MRLTPKRPADPEVVDTATAEGKLRAALQAGRTYVDVTVPRTDPPVAAKLRRLTRREEEQVSLELGAWFHDVERRGAPPPGRLELDAQQIARVLALAVRAPAKDVAADPAPLASLEEWQECDDAQLGALWNAYQDLVERTTLLPLDITPAQLAELDLAVKKKDATTLLSFGAAVLTAYLVTRGSPPAS